MEVVNDINDGAHLPGDNRHADWQESLAFQFHDARSRVGGFIHIGLQRNIDRADIWTWLVVEGRTVHGFQHLDLRLPARDFPALELGPLRYTATAPAVGRRVEIVDGEVHLSVDYTAFEPPIHYPGTNGSSGNFAHGHFETMGRVRGRLTIAGKVHPIDAWAFDDRSWGERDWTSLLNHRFLWASFGLGLHLSAYTVESPSGRRDFGFIHDGGVRHYINRVDIDVLVKSDGLRPKSFEAIVWTENAGGYRLTGQSDGAMVCTQRASFMESASTCQMEMNGKIGAGILEFSELKQPSAAVIREFGLMPHPEDGRPWPVTD